MRQAVLALITASVLSGQALAQSAAQQMLDSAARLRATAEQLKDTLPADARADMLAQAAEIEKGVREGVYGPVSGAAEAAKPERLSHQLEAQHGRLDWLAPKAACAGYTTENYLTFRYQSAINDRDSHCRNAFGHWATYLRVVRDGDTEAAERALSYYDAAARRAVTLMGEK
jgi:hypothetical protein